MTRDTTAHIYSIITLTLESFFGKIVIYSICFSVNIPKFYGILVLKNVSQQHCVKSVRILSFSGPYFPTFGLKPERYSVHTGEYKQEKLRIRTLFR